MPGWDPMIERLLWTVEVWVAPRDQGCSGLWGVDGTLYNKSA